MIKFKLILHVEYQRMYFVNVLINNAFHRFYSVNINTLFYHLNIFCFHKQQGRISKSYMLFYLSIDQMRYIRHPKKEKEEFLFTRNVIFP